MGPVIIFLPAARDYMQITNRFVIFSADFSAARSKV
jgi:hypothetical protein